MRAAGSIVLWGILWFVLFQNAAALLEDHEGDGSCPSGQGTEYFLHEGHEDETRWSIFDQLSIEETWDVINFLVDDMGFFHERNVTYELEDMPLPTGPSHVYRVELLEPPKEEAVAYLDGEGPRPKRYAKAIVFRAAHTPKDVMEYKIGPLPLPKDSRSRKELKKKGSNRGPRPGVTVEQLLEDGEVPFVKRPTHKYTAVWSERIVARTAYQLKEVFLDTTGFCYGHDDSTPELQEKTTEECGIGMLYWLEFPVVHSNDSKRVSHAHWFFKPRNGGGDEFELHGVPITFKIDESSDDVDSWDVVDIEYCHQGPFRSVEAFLDVYRNDPKLVKCTAPDWKRGDYDERWSKTSGMIAFRDSSEKASPRTYEPEGRRYQVSSRSQTGGHHFKYLGWEGHVGIRPDTGIVFHDIRFRGNRIIYELALQEQYVAYSGYGGAGQVVYFDSYFGIGLSSFPLKRGVDCPESAEYLPVANMVLTGGVTESKDTICIFEEDGQTTEWRHIHTNGTSFGPHHDSVRRTALVVRTVATIGNYDYIYDIRFKLDASVQVDVVMAGYMESSYFGPNGETKKDLPFGTRVHEYTFANLHDHLSNWKIDLDVLGTENSIHRHEVKLGTWEEALKDVDPDGHAPGWHTSPYVKYVESTKPSKEFGINSKKDGDGTFIMTNDYKTNKWGQPRGYAIVHGGSASQLLPNGHPFTKAMSWSKYHLAVTQRKDSELKSHAGIYDMNIPQKPHVSFDNYLNGESIVDEDLVAWVTMGVQHIPRSEDIPLISNFGTSFYIKPWNYYENLVSLDVGNNDHFKPCNPRTGSQYDYHWEWA